MSQQIIRPGDFILEKVEPGALIKSNLINAIIENLQFLNSALPAGATGLVSVPNFVGRTLANARSILSEPTTHLNLGSVFDASGVGYSGAAANVQARLIVNQVPPFSSRVPSGTAIDLVLAFQPSTSTTTASNRPTITTVVGSQPGEVRIGDPVTINGSNFELIPGNNQVIFGSTNAPTPLSSNGDALVVVVPEISPGESVEVRVRVPGRTPNDTSLPVTVKVLPRAEQPQPVITGVSVPAGNPANTITEGDDITINGMAFAASVGNNRIFLSSIQITPDESRSTPTALVVRVPDTLSEALGISGSGRRAVPIRVRNLDIEDPTRNVSAEFTDIILEV
jgi:hypothetical protein